MTNTRKNGFSLVELLVAVAISMVAMVALTDLYASTRGSSRVQAMQSRLTDDGRFAIFMLQRLVAQAGHRSSQTDMPVRLEATSETSTKIQFIGEGSHMIDCNGNTVSEKKTITISSSVTSLQCEDGTTTQWIAPAGSDGKGTELTSFRIGYGIDTAATYQGGSALATEYLCSTGKDCIADSYVYGETTDTVVAVHFCLVLRTEEKDSSVAKTAAVKDCKDQEIPDSKTDGRLYRKFNTTVLLKNR